MAGAHAITLVALAIVARVEPPNVGHLRLVRGDDGAMGPKRSPTTHDLIRLYMQRCVETALDGYSARPMRASTLIGYRSHAWNLCAALDDVDAATVDENGQPRAFDHGVIKSAAITIATKGKLGTCPNGRPRGGKDAARAAMDLFRAAWEHAVASRVIPRLASPTEDPEIRRVVGRARRRRETFVEADVLSAIVEVARELSDHARFRDDVRPRISPVAARAIELGARLGQRVKSDILPLRVGCVSPGPDGPVLLIRSAKAHGKPFRLPLPPEAHALVLECEANARKGWLFPGGRAHDGRTRKGHLDNVYDAWEAIVQTLLERGVDVRDLDGDLIVPHQLRHGFITHALLAGVAPQDIGPAVCQTDPGSMLQYVARGPIASAAPALAFEKVLRGNQMPKPSKAAAPESSYHERLCGEMERAGLSAADLAAALTEDGYSVGRRAVEYWRSGRTRPQESAYAYLCPLLDTTIDYLVRGVR
jgi:integrase